MRPVTLSRAANTAMGFLMISARATPTGSAAIETVSHTKHAAPAKPRARTSLRCIMLHTS
jgi:hypothetical protein